MTQHQQAIQVQQAGGPEVLTMQEVAVPEPGAGEVLVQVAATGVNFIEIYQRQGVYPMELPFTPGSEFAGTVIAVGPEVSSDWIGKRVMTSAGSGAYAHYALTPVAKSWLVSDTVSDEVAAALPLQGLTAHYLATSSYSIQPGDEVLIHAAAGGVGRILTQLAVARGARVLATASTDAKRQLALEAGADMAVDYAAVPEAVAELTQGRGVRAVYDGVGAATFETSLAALATRGTMVLFGGASGQVPPFDLQRLNQGGSLTITRPSLAHFLEDSAEVAWRYGELLAAIADGTLQIHLDRTYPLAQAAAAHTALAGRQTTGKVLLLP